MRCKLALLIGIFCIIFGTACTHERRVAELRPFEQSNGAYIFGFIKLYYDGKDVTAAAKVYLNSGGVTVLGTKGFYAAAVQPLRWNKIKTIKLQYNGRDYELPNLWILSAKAGSKTYFGHLKIEITRSSTLQRDDIEEWNWKVENNWKEAAIEWSHYFKEDKIKSFSSIARRTGPNTPTTRKIATDRQDVDVGF